jgi:hypothetical protein
MTKKIGFIAMSGVRVQNQELLAMVSRCRGSSNAVR